VTRQLNAQTNNGDAIILKYTQRTLLLDAFKFRKFQLVGSGQHFGTWEFGSC